MGERPGGRSYVNSPLLTVVTASAQDYDETQMGAQVFQELKSKGEVVASSPLYDELRPIASADLDSAHFSRQQEESADLTGADTCAAAGINPWGLVWLLRDFSNAELQTAPEVLSDHPNDAHRIAALERHFSENPRFGRFSSNPRTATPLNIPKNEPEKFLR